MVTKDNFVKGNFWFDEHEQSRDRQYSHPFDRSRMIKEIIFDINAQKQASGEPLLNFDAFIELLRTPYARCNTAKLFNDFLFAPVKPSSN